MGNQIIRGSEQDACEIHTRLQAYNAGYITDCDEFCFCVRSVEGTLLGGIAASRDLDCVTVDYLFVAEQDRRKGLGAELLNRAEEEGRRQGARRGHTEHLFLSGAGVLREAGLPPFWRGRTRSGRIRTVFLYQRIIKCPPAEGRPAYCEKRARGGSCSASGSGTLYTVWRRLTAAAGSGGPVPEAAVLGQRALC